MVGLYVFVTDCLTLTISYLAAYYLYFLVMGRESENDVTALVVQYLAIFLVEILAGRNSGFLQRRILDEIISVFRNTLLFALFLSFLIFVIHAVDDVSRMVTLFTIVLYFGLDIAARLLLKKSLRKRAGKESDRLLLVASPENAEDFVRVFNGNPTSYRRVTAVVLPDGYEKGMKIREVPVVADRNGMFRFAREQIVDEAVLFLPDENPKVLQAYLDEFESMGIVVSIIQQNVDIARNYLVSASVIGGYPAMTYTRTKQSPRQMVVKRMTDLFFGIFGSAFTLLLTIILGPIIKLDSKGPVFFKQKRVGRNGRFFMMYKFRTMCADAEAKKADLMEQNEMSGQMFKITDDPRVTRVGKFLRRTSLDEFPQFFNILKGDMSLIGTRPPTVDEFLKYEDHHKRRLSMKPGLTGLWQVSGRSDISDFEEVVRLDCEYIDNWSLALDLRIFLKTILVVFRHDGSR